MHCCDIEIIFICFLMELRIYEGLSMNKFTKWRHSISSSNRKNSKYTFCRQFNSEYKLWASWRWHYSDVIYKH